MRWPIGLRPPGYGEGGSLFLGGGAVVVAPAWLGFTRASDPPVCCFAVLIKLSWCVFFSFAMYESSKENGNKW